MRVSTEDQAREGFSVPEQKERFNNRKLYQGNEKASWKITII